MRLPELRIADWRPTKDTLHLYAQIVGKVRLATAPPRNQLVVRTLDGRTCSFPIADGLSVADFDARLQAVAATTLLSDVTASSGYMTAAEADAAAAASASASASCALGGGCLRAVTVTTAPTRRYAVSTISAFVMAFPSK
jgi:hypothetical protein